MGAHKGGEVASRVVVSELTRFLSGRIKDFGSVADPLAELAASIKDLHDHVKRVGVAKDLEGMGATLVCGLCYGHSLHFAHVGDSRIYHMRGGELKQLTEDHSTVGVLRSKGKINEREARNHPWRSILRQALGAEVKKVQPQTGTLHLKPGDRLLFCSDGVMDGLWDFRIKEALATGAENDENAEKTLDALLSRAFDEAGQDDTTAIVVRID